MNDFQEGEPILGCPYSNYMYKFRSLKAHQSILAACPRVLKNGNLSAFIGFVLKPLVLLILELFFLEQSDGKTFCGW